MGTADHLLPLGCDSTFTALKVGLCITAPAHQHATWVAVFPALFLLTVLRAFLVDNWAFFRVRAKRGKKAGAKSDSARDFLEREKARGKEKAGERIRDTFVMIVLR